MAIKPTIYKLRIALSDLERNYYDNLSLTVALHPSETPERMMARVVAYCINAQEGLVFTKGLSDVDEPDLWVRTLDGQTSLWIDVGEPAPDRVKKAIRLAQQVKVYCFNAKSDAWWQQGRKKFDQLDLEVTRLNTSDIEQLKQLLQRTLDLSVTITGQSAFIATNDGEVEVNWDTLQARK